MSSRIFRDIVLTTGLFAAITLSPECASAQNVSIKAELDSAVLMMGRTTPLHIEILQPKGTHGTLLLSGDTIMTNVEIANVGIDDTVSKGSADQLEQIRRQITLQSFDSGLYRLPPIAYMTDGGDTVFSNQVTLKVLPADVDSMTTIHSMADVADGGWRWFDWLPDFIIDYWVWMLVVLLIAGAGVWTWLVMKKKVSIPLVPKAKPVSPYDAAIAGLEKLKDERLCESGREKEYYTRLTDILRRYLDGRFGINAMEMTSSQILRALEKQKDTREHKVMMQRVLEMADFVKFAKMRPMPDDNVAAWNRALQFVEETKPLPESVASDSDNNEGAVANVNHNDEMKS